MLFGFRGIRLFQVMLAIVALCMGVGCALALKAATDDRAILAMLAAVVFGFVFLWAFATALRAPTSFVAVGDDRTRVRFAGFVDTVVLNSDIISVRIVSHPWWAGIGVRTGLRGTVSMVTAPGRVAEVHLRNPVRIWAIPRIWRVKATSVRLSVRNPDKLVERFSANPAEEQPARPVARPQRGNRRR